eukprot:COSAG03_NODE_24054_length_275_cov_0.585227_1_plen_57_part_01
MQANADLMVETVEDTEARYQAIELARDAQRRRELPAMRTPPEGPCCKKKPALATWTE